MQIKAHGLETHELLKFDFLLDIWIKIHIMYNTNINFSFKKLKFKLK